MKVADSAGLEAGWCVGRALGPGLRDEPPPGDLEQTLTFWEVHMSPSEEDEEQQGLGACDTWPLLGGHSKGSEWGAGIIFFSISL